MTLAESVNLAYQTNPALRAKREDLRTLDERYIQARSKLGASIELSAQTAYQFARIDQQVFGTSSAQLKSGAATGSVDLSLTQPLYAGGQVSADISAAVADILSGREQLRGYEAEFLQSVITAYLDVAANEEALAATDEAIAHLAAINEEVRAKGRLGDLTKTDVAQAEARLLAAQARREAVRGRLDISRSAFEGIVGAPADGLSTPAGLPGLPATVGAALDAADANSPKILAAIYAQKASAARVASAKGAGRGHVDLKLDAADTPTLQYDGRYYDRSFSASVIYSQKLYSSGLYDAQIREALAARNRDALQVEAARRDVIANVTQDWRKLAATEAILKLEQPQLEALMLAVKGNRIEERVGKRSVIELLNAEEELLALKLTFVQDRHDRLVAQASVLQAMGRLDVDLVAPGAAPYRPETALRQSLKQSVIPQDRAITMIDQIGAPRP